MPYIWIENSEDYPFYSMVEKEPLYKASYTKVFVSNSQLVSIQIKLKYGNEVQQELKRLVDEGA